MIRITLKTIALSISFLLQLGIAQAIDLQPGDVIAPLPGYSSINVAYQYSEKNDFYKDGKKVAGYSAMNSSLYITRIGHSFEFAGMPAYTYVQAPLGAIHAQGIAGDSGIGDASFAFAIWPYANHETKTYLGLAAYLVAPTGSYESGRSINIGENRYRTALQAGFQAPITEQISGMAAFDTVWFGDNTDYTAQHKKLEQDPLYTAQLGLRYDFNAQYLIAGVYYYTFGAENTVNGIDLSNQTQLHRYQLNAVAKYSFGRFMLQYGSDLKTENGYFEDQRLILRYVAVF